MGAPKELWELHGKVQKGLKATTQDEADALVEPGMGDAGVFVEAVVAQHGLFYASLVSEHKLRNTAAARKTISEQQAITLTLMYYAYAAGVKRGREEGAK